MTQPMSELIILNDSGKEFKIQQRSELINSRACPSLHVWYIALYVW